MHALPTLPTLAYGGDYNPEQWPAEVWREDARLMREAGVNLVSLGIFSWAKLQPSADRFDFDWLDEVMGLLHDQGVAVNLATATASPPAWLVRAHPEMMPVTAEGAVLGHGSRQHYAPWSQAYRKHARVLVRAVAQRYATHPALVSWHINNELACHVHESFDPETIDLWRQWLEQRYADVATVNRTWNTAFWSQAYGSLDEIGAPRLGPTFLNPGMCLDWRRFCAEAFVDLVRMEAAILREVTPDIPLNTNFVGWHDLPLINHRAIAAEIDYISWDSYPDPAGGLEQIQANALCHDFMRSLKPGRPFILMEQGTGAVNWRAFNQPRSPGMTRALSHQALARGADGVMFFQWRQSRSGAEQFHSGMLPIQGRTLAGHEHRIWTLTKQLGDDLTRAKAVAGSTIHADVALLVDYESMWATSHGGKPTRVDVMNEVTRHHRPLWERNVAVDLRHPEDDLTGYRLVIAPAVQLLSDNAIDNLHAFVDRGGHLAFTPFTGIGDTTTCLREGGLPGRLTDVFGVAVEEWIAVAPTHRGRVKSETDADPGPLAWTHFAELIHATTARVLARFDGGNELTDSGLDGRPALTQNAHGRGQAWYLAAQFDRPSLDQIIAHLLDAADVRGVLDTPQGVEASLRQAEDSTTVGLRYLHLINHQADPVTIDLKHYRGEECLTDPPMMAGHTLELPPLGVAIIQLDPPVD